MKFAMILDNGFEDTEAIATRDVLIRAGIEVETLSAKMVTVVKSSFGIYMEADSLLKNANPENFDGVILPGGKVGVDNLKKSDDVKNFVLKIAEKGKYLCAICAAPSILGELGLLKNKRFTCYKGFQEGIHGTYVGSDVEVDGKVITARSMAYSQNFGLTIIENILGKATKEKVFLSISSL